MLVLLVQCQLCLPADGDACVWQVICTGKVG